MRDDHISMPSQSLTHRVTGPSGRREKLAGWPLPPLTHSLLLLLDVIMQTAGGHGPQFGLRRLPTMSLQLAYQGYYLPK